MLASALECDPWVNQRVDVRLALSLGEKRKDPRLTRSWLVFGSTAQAHVSDGQNSPLPS